MWIWGSCVLAASAELLCFIETLRDSGDGYRVPEIVVKNAATAYFIRYNTCLEEVQKNVCFFLLLTGVYAHKLDGNKN